ncbi:GNAT family N-acetyltransferase [Fictibacillus aquaticus]|uniref:GNAT family N-acetyltransferase n=1 Tax=Fictibacillus aquaticus TaxID=2021314 RepID=A0A235F8C5_9BACL|nr:GNAT family N-acetyltransferase [Fictibacillus aquaticus]OYD57314.1 GNAT family N-acetyltransferase [Fictibacillus aquaticus]
MKTITLAKHDLKYAQRIFELASQPQVRDALGLRDTSVEDTLSFLNFIMDEEREGRVLSRVILNEDGELVGITELKKIDRELKRCHIGSWIGHEYWGMGYNQASKLAILSIAFEELGMEHVFAGARAVNLRSQKAQEKLPYFSLHVESQFPEELEWLETREKQPCVLHAVFRQDFLGFKRELVK